MAFVLGVTFHLLFSPPIAGVLPIAPSVQNPWEEQDNRHARRRDAKRSR